MAEIKEPLFTSEILTAIKNRFERNWFRADEFKPPHRAGKARDILDKLTSKGCLSRRYYKGNDREYRLIDVKSGG